MLMSFIPCLDRSLHVCMFSLILAYVPMFVSLDIVLVVGIVDQFGDHRYA